MFEVLIYKQCHITYFLQLAMTRLYFSLKMSHTTNVGHNSWILKSKWSLLKMFLLILCDYARVGGYIVILLKLQSINAGMGLANTVSIYRALMHYLSGSALSKSVFSPCLCPLWSSVVALACLLALPSGVCAEWTGCSWWPTALQTGCGAPGDTEDTFRKSKRIMLCSALWESLKVPSEWADLDRTSSLKFLKAATLSSTLSWLSGRSFKRSITWQGHTEKGQH